jgi:mannan endo-1,4-beta-mannosidase
MRACFFHVLATTNGRRDWSAFDHTLAVASRHGVNVIATLTNQWGDCEANAAYKKESWYARGYRQRTAGSGLPASYRAYVGQIVARYRDDATILACQLVNEAEDATSEGGPCSDTATATLTAFASDVGGLIKARDGNHLVSLGTIGGAQCGTDDDRYTAVHGVRSIDMRDTTTTARH